MAMVGITAGQEKISVQGRIERKDGVCTSKMLNGRHDAAAVYCELETILESSADRIHHNHSVHLS